MGSAALRHQLPQSGRGIVHTAANKVARVRAWCDERGIDPLIEVDGGVSEDTIGELAAADANAFVAGSAVFGKSDHGAAVEALRKAATRALRSVKSPQHLVAPAHGRVKETVLLTRPIQFARPSRMTSRALSFLTRNDKSPFTLPRSEWV